MNERIRELAEQARHWAHFGGLAQNPKSSPDVLFEQKFAELIVRECAGVGYDASYYECALNVSNKIKQHFGVEE
jgi:hypothetical protein